MIVQAQKEFKFFFPPDKLSNTACVLALARFPS